MAALRRARGAVCVCVGGGVMLGLEETCEVGVYVGKAVLLAEGVHHALKSAPGSRHSYARVRAFNSCRSQD